LIDGDAINGPEGRTDLSQLSPLVLAYIGDSIYEVYIRVMLTRNIGGGVHKLHMEATRYVRCSAQSDVIHAIFEELSEQERDIVRRGRNAHSGYVPKNANVTEYRYATGFEALLGYLFMKRSYNRLEYILRLATQKAAG